MADAIDTMRSKVSLLEFAYNNYSNLSQNNFGNKVVDKSHLPVISSFGAGNRVSPEDLYMCDISEIEDKKAPFVSNILHQLKQRNITRGITVIASREKPFSRGKITAQEKILTDNGDEIEFAKITPASTPFVASTAGIFMASYIVQKLINK